MKTICSFVLLVVSFIYFAVLMISTLSSLSAYGDCPPFSHEYAYYLLVALIVAVLFVTREKFSWLDGSFQLLIVAESFVGILFSSICRFTDISLMVLFFLGSLLLVFCSLLIKSVKKELRD